MAQIKLGSILIKLIHPGHLWRMYQLSRQKKARSTTRANTQLKLYARILPGDFLHYGFFDNPEIAPEEMSIRDIQNAQVRYAELLIEQIADRDAPVMDAGCGQGGLLRLLSEKGLSAVGLTPDIYQIEYIRETYPAIPLLHAKFEETPLDEYDNFFGTVIHSESLQYIALDEALKVVEQILKPGGRWIVCDYFRTGKAAEKSGIKQEVFLQAVREAGFKIVAERDITPNVLPTLSFVHMWGHKIGVPVLDFALDKLEAKKPAIYYLIQDILEPLRKKIDKNLKVVDPGVFQASKSYLLYTLERA
ncbi:MAG: methyltransferase domain-containing protein [Calditrichaeota bacterium]|nr:methyltransferase domain-containing protein [Calditrichota bacterium]HQU71593.1 methyltransferase domain-containing protein [Calditrichia bacterium]